MTGVGAIPGRVAAKIRPPSDLPPRRSDLAADAIAGVSVAVVLVPQAMAYAEMAGLPAWQGLLASGLPPLVSALWTSSPWLQSGPTAMSALLTQGVLASMALAAGADTRPETVMGRAALLALMIGAIRLTLGRLRLGVLASLLSRSVLVGFSLAAALLIAASQLPAVLDADVAAGSTLARGVAVLLDPQRWRIDAVVISLTTLLILVVSPRIHRLLPGVLIAVGAGAVAAPLLGYQGATVADGGGLDLYVIGVGIWTTLVAIPWGEVPLLLVPATTLALAGFAEAAAVAQRYAEIERVRWDPDRELLGQGAANLVAGAIGSMPVGGSFARSAISHMAGARTALAGAIASCIVLCLMPIFGLLETLPRAVLAAIVLMASWSLFDLRPLLRLGRLSRSQSAIALGTFGMTLATAPHVELGLLAGTAAAIAVHLWRELEVHVEVEARGDELWLRPQGVLWFGSAPRFRQRVADVLADPLNFGPPPTAARALVLDLGGLGKIDLSGALTLRELIDSLQEGGVDVRVADVPLQLRDMLGRVTIATSAVGPEPGGASPAPPDSPSPR